MNKNYLIGIGIIILLLITGIIIGNTIKASHQKTTSTTSAAKRAPLPKEATVILDKNGFTPKEVRINVGSAVRWVNKSGSQQTVNSDNYPTNQLHKELNFGVFNNGSSVVHTFVKPGTYGYHNQFHHEQAGKIIVER